MPSFELIYFPGVLLKIKMLHNIALLSTVTVLGVLEQGKGCVLLLQKQTEHSFIDCKKKTLGH